MKMKDKPESKEEKNDEDREIQINILGSVQVDFRPEKPRKRRNNDDYDYNDPFLEPFEGEFDAVELECKLENFFIYKGKMEEDPRRISRKYNNSLKRQGLSEALLNEKSGKGKEEPKRQYFEFERRLEKLTNSTYKYKKDQKFENLIFWVIFVETPDNIFDKILQQKVLSLKPVSSLENVDKTELNTLDNSAILDSNTIVNDNKNVLDGLDITSLALKNKGNINENDTNTSNSISNKDVEDDYLKETKKLRDKIEEQFSELQALGALDSSFSQDMRSFMLFSDPETVQKIVAFIVNYMKFYSLVSGSKISYVKNIALDYLCAMLPEQCTNGIKIKHYISKVVYQRIEELGFDQEAVIRGNFIKKDLLLCESTRQDTEQDIEMNSEEKIMKKAKLTKNEKIVKKIPKKSYVEKTTSFMWESEGEKIGSSSINEMKSDGNKKKNVSNNNVVKKNDNLSKIFAEIKTEGDNKKNAVKKNDNLSKNLVGIKNEIKTEGKPVKKLIKRVTSPVKKKREDFSSERSSDCEALIKNYLKKKEARAEFSNSSVIGTTAIPNILNTSTERLNTEKFNAGASCEYTYPVEGGSLFDSEGIFSNSKSRESEKSLLFPNYNTKVLSKDGNDSLPHNSDILSDYGVDSAAHRAADSLSFNNTMPLTSSYCDSRGSSMDYSNSVEHSKSEANQQKIIDRGNIVESSSPIDKNNAKESNLTGKNGSIDNSSNLFNFTVSKSESTDPKFKNSSENSLTDFFLSNAFKPGSFLSREKPTVYNKDLPLQTSQIKRKSAVKSAPQLVKSPAFARSKIDSPDDAVKKPVTVRIKRKYNKKSEIPGDLSFNAQKE